MSFKLIFIDNIINPFFSSQETYPHTPPVWFAESEETNISNAIQLLSNTSGLDNHVINQVSKTFVILSSFFVFDHP